MTAKRVVSLGQCAADTWTIGRLFETAFGIDVVGAATFDEAFTALRPDGADLVLVNRVLDFTGESGVEFIRRLKADPALTAVPVMLVSNYPDAQQQAVQLGALPGFGKAALRDPQTQQRLRDALGLSPAEQAS